MNGKISFRKKKKKQLNEIIRCNYI
jgi:hypothetical protein